MFKALCETCPWEGPVRSDSLKAVRDYDRHVAGIRHHERLAEIKADALLDEPSSPFAEAAARVADWQ
jgi:hypothetical protein